MSDLWPGRHDGYIHALVSAARRVGDHEAVRRSMFDWADTQAGSGVSLDIVYALDADPNDFAAAGAEAKILGINLTDYTLLENVIFSPTGQWGVAFDEDLWAVVGGTPDFMHEFAACASVALEDEMRAHMEWCRWMFTRAQGESALEWLPSHIAYIVGRARAEQLLTEFAIPVPPGAW